MRWEFRIYESGDPDAAPWELYISDPRGINWSEHFDTIEEVAARITELANPTDRS